MKNRRLPPRGTTLIEVIITLAILAGAGLGTMVSLAASSRSLRDGQMTQHKMMLLDAKTQQRLLSNKANIWNQAQPGWSPATATAPTYPPNVAIGTVPWQLDVPVTATDPNDLSQGAYFSIGTNGEIQRLDITNPAAVPPGTPCSALPAPGPGVPVVYCREVALTQGPPLTVPSGAASQVALLGGRVVTYWIRVSRAGESASNAMYRREVLSQ